MDLLAKACGATGPIRLHLQAPDGMPRVEHVLETPFAVLGRHASADIVLEHSELHRRHLYLQVLQGRIHFVFLAGLRTTDEASPVRVDGWLPDEQFLTVGPYGIKQADDVPSDDEPGPVPLEPLTAPVFASDGLPEMMLDCVEGIPRRRAPWRIRQMLTLIGKAPGCRLQLISSTVSSVHASLVRTPLGVWVIDLLGRGGITVNDVKVRAARLHEGDRLRVGRFVFHALPVVPERRPIAAALPGQPKSTSDGLATVGHDLAAAGKRDNGISRSDAVASIPTSSGESLIASLGLPLDAWPGEHSADLHEPAILPLLQEFSRMQRDMLGQFQTIMLALVQSFGELHREQNGYIHAELHRLRSLVPAAAPGESGDGASPAKAGAPPKLSPTTNGVSPARASAASVAERLQPKEPAEQKHLASQRAQLDQPHAGQAVAASDAKSSAGVAATEQVHNWLTERLLTLESEQKTRLQRLLSRLLRLGE
jgi:hypothetical protein